MDISTKANSHANQANEEDETVVVIIYILIWMVPLLIFISGLYLRNICPKRFKIVVIQRHELEIF
jgi:hypothetical protein